MQSGLDADRGGNTADSTQSQSDSAEGKVARKNQLGSAAHLKLVADESIAKTHLNANNKIASSEIIQAHQYQYLAARQSALLEIVAHFLDKPNLQSALVAVSEAIHSRFQCSRVAIGLARNDAVTVTNISQQSSFDARSGEVHLLNEAMQEASDQDQIIHFIAGFGAKNEGMTIVESHRAVLSGVRTGQICSIPLCDSHGIVGVLLIESHDGDSWNPLTIDLQQQIAQTIAPLISLRQSAELSLLERAKRAFTDTIEKISSPHFIMAKLVSAACLLMLVLAYFLPVTHKINTSAELVSTERRLVTSPIQGYVDSVHIAVGDTVSAGQLLVSLDVKDLQNQAQQLESKIQSAESEYRSVMASHDRKSMAIAQAQLDQVRSELELINSQIGRAQLLAPVSGVIVSGDLSLILGAPVERGATLLEMAPEANYEIQLSINEADVGYVKPGQLGNLTLKSNPFEQIPFEVTQVHPIAEVGEGATRFRLDAAPRDSIDGLRPGQTGVAKIDVGEARLLWIWTHKVINWAKLKLWGWF